MMNSQVGKRMKTIQKLVGAGRLHGESQQFGGTNPGAGMGESVLRTPSRGTRIVWRDFVGDIVTHPTVVGGLNIQALRLNPSSTSTFPWMSQIAPNFDKWQANGIIFEFTSMCSNFSTDSALGSVICATEYDIMDPPYTSKTEMLTSAYSTQSRMDKNVIHGIECDPATLQHSIFYTHPDEIPIPAGASPRDYTLATFYIATVGGNIPVNTNIGSLWVHYDITFLEEELAANRPIPGQGMLGGSFYRKLLPTEGGGWSSWGDATLIAGPDIGITITNGGVVFPAELQGKTFWISMGVSKVGGDGYGGARMDFPEQFITYNCTLSTDQGGNGTGDINVVQAGGGQNTQRGQMCAMIVRIEKVMTSEQQAGFAIYPAGTWPGDNNPPPSNTVFSMFIQEVEDGFLAE